MSIRDILVHLDNLETTGPRLDLAVSYARKHGARLRGLYLSGPAFFELRSRVELSDYERTENMFLEKSAAAGVASEWVRPGRSDIGINTVDLMATQAYYTDMVIVGQSNIPPRLDIPPELPARLVMLCGRPVLTVPYSCSIQTAGERIMIAWKAGRESVRSVSDALPCIEKAHQVSLVEVSAEAIPPESNNHIINIREFIACHNVKARSEQVYSGDFSVGDTILNLACEKSADLLVMGAYAYSKRGALTLSPVAGHILKHLTLPVLMSH